MSNQLERVNPADVGLSGNAILKYLEKLQACGTEMHGLMIAGQGKVCAEGWWKPYSPGLIHTLASLIKSYVVTAVGTLTPGQLARIMLRSNYSITKVIDGLEKDNLVKRYPNGEDRRRIKVTVTSEGLEYVIASFGDVMETESELKDWLDEEERESLPVIIRKLRDKLIEKISDRYMCSERQVLC